MVRERTRRIKTKSKKRSTQKVEQPLNSDDDEQLARDQPDPKSNSYFYDEVDEFTQATTQVKKYKHRKKRRGSDHDDSSEEEILPLGSDGDDDDIYGGEEEEDGFDQLKKMADEFGASHLLAKDNDLAKELENEELDDDEPEVENWGKFKSAYYGELDDVEESSGEEAEEEETEALALQKKLNLHLDEGDFGLELLPAVKDARPAFLEDDDDEQIVRDVSLMSHEERVQQVITESPELLVILDDVQDKVKELEGEVAPLAEMLKNNKIPEGAGAEYIRTRFHLLTNYIMNVNMYLILKSERKPVQNHPVIARLIEYKQLLQDLDSVRSNLQDEMLRVLDRDALKLPKKKKHLIQQSKKKLSAAVADDSKKRKTVSFIDDLVQDEAKRPSKKSKKTPEVKKVELPPEDELDRFSDQSDELADDKDQTGEDRDRRSITKKILKNRGLTPHRAKKYGNPRIKNKSKYEKAMRKHRSQVPAHRQEIQRYGGETGGIRSTIVKSRKFD